MSPVERRRKQRRLGAKAERQPKQYTAARRRLVAKVERANAGLQCADAALERTEARWERVRLVQNAAQLGDRVQYLKSVDQRRWFRETLDATSLCVATRCATFLR